MKNIIIKSALISVLMISSGMSFAETFDDGMKSYQAQNYKKAYEIWTAQAKKGQMYSQYNLAVMYEKGKGIPVDLRQAVYWYSKASDQGYPLAQYNLGALYFSGKGVTKDYKIAAKFWEKASNAGSTSSQYNLGILYLTGTGVDKNRDTALKWLKKAAETGHIRAKEQYAKLSENDASKLAKNAQSTNVAGIKDVRNDKATDVTKVTEIAKNSKTENISVKKELKKTAKPIVTPKIVTKNDAKNKLKVVAEKQSVNKKSVVKKEIDKKLKNKDIAQVKTKDKVRLKNDKKPIKFTQAEKDKSLSNKEKKTAELKLSKAKELKDKLAKKQLNKSKVVKPIKLDKKVASNQNSWVKQQQPSSYTVQLTVTNSVAGAKSFINKHGIKSVAHYYKIKDKNMYKVVAGVYKSSKAASDAVNKLPPRLKRSKPWPKSFRAVKQEAQ